MLQIKVLGDEWKKEFDKLTTHPLQSWEWGEFRAKTGNEVIRLGLFKDNKLQEVYQLTVHLIPHTQLKLAILLKCTRPTKESLKLLKIFGEKNNFVFIRIEPNIHPHQETENDLKELGAVRGKNLLTKSTFVIDLTKTEEEILSKMHPKTRYNIRIANKQGVLVKEDNTKSAFEEYLDLMDETTRRQGFYAHTENYHRLMWEKLHNAGIAHLLIARYKDEALTAWVLFVWKDTLYYPYGASTEKNKNIKASHKMMWETIKYGKSLGLKKFDLWGREEGKGFTRFKEGFSPEVVEFIGTWDLIIKPQTYKAFRLAEELRWKLLHIKAKLNPFSNFR